MSKKYKLVADTHYGKIEWITYRDYTHVVVTRREYLSRNHHLLNNSKWTSYEKNEYRTGLKQAQALKRIYDSGKTPSGGYFRGSCEIYELQKVELQ